MAISIKFLVIIWLLKMSKKHFILALSTFDIDFWLFVTRKKKAGDGTGVFSFTFVM